MDYFQSVVAEYLQQDRCNFINTEFLISHRKKQSDKGTPEWLVDILCVSMRDARIYLCEVSYSPGLQSLLKRTRGWRNNWDLVTSKVREHSLLPASLSDWPIQVWLFVPQDLEDWLRLKLPSFDHQPKITSLERVLPWRYDRWPREWRKEKEPL
jgi:hypothetical protein